MWVYRIVGILAMIRLMRNEQVLECDLAFEITKAEQNITL